eukprot:scaffold19144_cov118-Isochrysis_galbana.AAC.1
MLSRLPSWPCRASWQGPPPARPPDRPAWALPPLLPPTVHRVPQYHPRRAPRPPVVAPRVPCRAS